MANKEQLFIVSNNPSVWQHFSGCNRVQGSSRDAMECVRSLVHKGHRLLGHALAGSIRLLCNPYRSVVVLCQRKELDSQTILQVEDACFRLSQVDFGSVPEQALFDYEHLDLSLLEALLTDGKLVEKAFPF